MDIVNSIVHDISVTAHLYDLNLGTSSTMEFITASICTN